MVTGIWLAVLLLRLRNSLPCAFNLQISFVLYVVKYGVALSGRLFSSHQTQILQYLIAYHN